MNNFTSAHKKRQYRKKPIFIPISNLPQQPRDKRQSQSKQSSETSQSWQRISPLRRWLNDLPTLFTARKRQQYAGYKQLSFNKSKLVKFNSTNSKQLFNDAEQKCQANLKDIIKLKKRYSLQPSYFRTRYRQESRMDLGKKPKMKHQSSINSIEDSQQHKLRQIMKNILFKNKRGQRLATSFSKQSRGFASQRCTEVEQNTDFQRYKSQLCTERSERPFQTNYPLPKHLKFCSQNNAGSSKHESKKRDNVRRTFIKTQSHHSDIKNNQTERQLSGWENKTMYGIAYNNTLRNMISRRRTKDKQ